MCGSDQNLHVNCRWMEVNLKMQGPDGLIYIPAKGRPWAHQFDNDYLAGGNPGAGKMGTECISSEAVSQRIGLSSDNSVAPAKKQRPRKPGNRFCLNTEICG